MTGPIKPNQPKPVVIPGAVQQLDITPPPSKPGQAAPPLIKRALASPAGGPLKAQGAPNHKQEGIDSTCVPQKSIVQGGAASRAISIKYKPSPDLAVRYKKLNLTGKSAWQSICSFFGYLSAKVFVHQSATNRSTQQQGNFKLSEPLQSLFLDIAASCEDMMASLDNEKKFNKSADQLAKHCDKLSNDEYAKDLPDGFSLKDLHQATFNACVQEMPVDQLRALIEKDDTTWDQYDNLMMGMILNAVKDRCFNDTPPPIHLSDVDKIALNTRIECYFSRFQTTQEKGALKELGEGATNTVFKANYSMGFQQDAEVTRLKAFKPVEDQFSKSPGLAHMYPMMGMGVDDKPRFIERNLASDALGQHLETNVIVETHPALHKGETGIVMELCNWDAKEGKPAIVKELADFAFCDQNQENWYIGPPLNTNAQFKKDLATLRALDYISGQFDRHEGNILVIFEADESGNPVYKGLKGIDNDFAWGSKVIPECERSGQPFQHWFKGMPAYLDHDLASRIMEMTDADIDAIGENRLTDTEKTAAKGRLQMLKQGLAGNSIKTIDSDDAWATVEVTEANHFL